MNLWQVTLEIHDPQNKWWIEDFEMYLADDDTTNVDSQNWEIYQSWCHSKGWQLKEIDHVGVALMTNGWTLFVAECQEIDESKNLPQITNIVHNK